jgi:hypothetical protein
MPSSRRRATPRNGMYRRGLRSSSHWRKAVETRGIAQFQNSLLSRLKDCLITAEMLFLPLRRSRRQPAIKSAPGLGSRRRQPTEPSV